MKYLYYLITIFVIAFVLFLFNSFNNYGDFVIALDTQPEEFERKFEVNIDYKTELLEKNAEIIQPATIRIFEIKIYVSDFFDFSINVSSVRLTETHTFVTYCCAME